MKPLSTASAINRDRRDPATADGVAALRVGDVISDVWADSTEGPIQLHRWAAGHFTVIFGHPSAYAPVSERDLVALARMQQRFAETDCRIVGVTQSDPVTERTWIDALGARYGLTVAFPILSDEEGRIVTALGMSMGDAEDGSTVATTIVLSPDLRVRAVLHHPHSIGRDPTEALRIVTALNAAPGDHPR